MRIEQKHIDLVKFLRDVLNDLMYRQADWEYTSKIEDTEELIKLLEKFKHGDSSHNVDIQSLSELPFRFRVF